MSYTWARLAGGSLFRRSFVDEAPNLDERARPPRAGEAFAVAIAAPCCRRRGREAISWRVQRSPGMTRLHLLPARGRRAGESRSTMFVLALDLEDR